MKNQFSIFFFKNQSVLKRCQFYTTLIFVEECKTIIYFKILKCESVRASKILSIPKWNRLKTNMSIAFEKQMWNWIRVDVVNVINGAPTSMHYSMTVAVAYFFYLNEIVSSQAASQLSNHRFELWPCRVSMSKIRHFAHFIRLHDGNSDKQCFWNEKVQIAYNGWDFCFIKQAIWWIAIRLEWNSNPSFSLRCLRFEVASIYIYGWNI